jgi:hypothetical protein
MTTQKDTLASAMAKAFAAIEGATKSAANPHFKSKYADLTSVIEAIKPALVANGLFFTQSPRPNAAGVEIETILHHASGETFSLGSLFVPADKNNAQAFGSALTYARRYALVTAFGVPVEDDDGNAAAASPPKREPAPKLISDSDWAILTTLIEATGSDAKKLCDYYKVAATNKLTVEQAHHAIVALNNKLKPVPQPADDLADDAAFLKGE